MAPLQFHRRARGRGVDVPPRSTPPAASPPGPPEPTDATLVLGGEDASLLDVVDNALSKGIVLSGDITLALANVDLVYLRLSLLLCAADRVLPGEDTDYLTRHSNRRLARTRAAARQRQGLPRRRPTGEGG
jgi:hypothetical protein